MYKMTIDVAGKQRALLLRRRTEMLEWWDDFLSLADGEEDIRSIRVWGTVGNKTDLVRHWVRDTA